jgi:Putative addiction module component
MDLSIPDWQRKILDERLAEDDANPDAGSYWREVKERILASLARPPAIPSSE